MTEPAGPTGPDEPGPASPGPASPGESYPAYHRPGEAPITPWEPAEPSGPPRQTTGVRSFVLALVPLLVTNLVSVVLAVSALTRPADGHDHGRGFAVVALLVDALVIAVWVLVLSLVLG